MLRLTSKVYIVFCLFYNMVFGFETFSNFIKYCANLYDQNLKKGLFLSGIDPEGGVLRYSISGPVFSVDRETGVVRLRQELDREFQDTIEVIISITDEGISGTEPNTISLRREIPVRDFNDNSPIFVGRPFSASISESAKPGAEIEVRPNIIVTDKDAGINSEVIVSCAKEANSDIEDICDTFDVLTEKV